MRTSAAQRFGRCFAPLCSGGGWDTCVSLTEKTLRSSPPSVAPFQAAALPPRLLRRGRRLPAWAGRRSTGSLVSTALRARKPSCRGPWLAGSQRPVLSSSGEESGGGAVIRRVAPTPSGWSTPSPVWFIRNHFGRLFPGGVTVSLIRMSLSKVPKFRFLPEVGSWVRPRSRQCCCFHLVAQEVRRVVRRLLGPTLSHTGPVASLRPDLPRTTPPSQEAGPYRGPGLSLVALPEDFHSGARSESLRSEAVPLA